jgi:transcriptional regulator with XRE-family HTH domain
MSDLKRLSDTAQRLGPIVRALRSRAGFSQESFSALVNLHRTFMGSLERGRVNPSLETLERLAHGLRMSAWELLQIAETSGPPVAERDRSRTREVAREPGTPVAPPRRAGA